MQTWKRRLGQFTAYSLLSVAAGAVLLNWLLPSPISPPLQTARGVVLDEEQQARLTELVFEAARTDDVTTIEAFLQEGFSPNHRSHRGDPLLTVAAYHDSRQVLKRLLHHPEIDLEARNRMGLTAVSAAAFKGYDDCLQVLIDRGADVNAANGSQQTALMFASLTGRTSTVQLLLGAGANPAARDAQGQTAASVAETQGAGEVLPLLRGK